ncbi:MAG: hypothetical protein M3Q46_03405 [Verrucomicrobiota bacterium]|nr:hypothetical protein [Verrucomicrobiota bacterium]
MRSRHTAHFARVALALLTFSAWFVATDHCALAAAFLRPAAATSAPAQESCPGHSQPEKQSPSELPCCKTLVATTAPAKISAGYDLHSFVLQPYLASAFQLLPGHSDAPPAEIDTGPPEADTFAESVLQRSILAHAPPCLS